MGNENGGCFGGGVFSPSNSLLNRALDCCARRLPPEREERGNENWREGEPKGRVCGHKAQRLRDSTGPWDGCGQENGVGTVAATNRRGKILTLNRENAKSTQTHIISALFGRVSLTLGLRQGRQEEGKSSRDLFRGKGGRKDKKPAPGFLL